MAQLFVLDTPEQSPPPTLNVTRWMAPIIMFYVVVEALLAVLIQQKQLLHTRLCGDHIAVIGNGPEAVSLIGNGTYCTVRKKVVVTDDLVPSNQAWLTGGGISVLPDPSDPYLARVLRGAKDMMAVGGDDNETVDLACRIASTAPTTQPLTLLDSPALVWQ